VSIDKPRKAGTPVYRKLYPGLRPVPNPDERSRPAPDAETQALLDDLKRRYRVQRERLTIDEPNEPKAA
jgi:hypothetical protein